MKTTLPLLVLSISILSSCSSSYMAQNGEFDGVYDPGGDAVVYYETTTDEEDPLADYDYVDPDFDPNNMSDYEYSSRIRRFHSDSDFGYYDPYFTNMGYYNPNPGNFGTSIYSDVYGYGSPYGNGGFGNGWNSSAGWNSWSGWSFGIGYSWGNPYGSMYGYNPFGYNPYNPWNPWSPFGSFGNPYCPNYFNSYDITSYVYAPRGQSQPNQAGYVQNAYQGAIKSETITPPSFDELVASTEPSVGKQRTYKNDRPKVVSTSSNSTKRQRLEAAVNRSSQVQKNTTDKIVSRDIQTRANSYYLQMERFSRSQNGYLNRFENQGSRSQNNSFLQRLEQFGQQLNSETLQNNSRGWGESPSLNRNQGGNSPSFRSVTPSLKGSSPSFNRSGGSNSRGGGSSGGGSRGGGRR